MHFVAPCPSLSLSLSLPPCFGCCRSIRLSLSMAFPLVGHQGRILENSLTTSLSSPFSKLSKGYDKSCGAQIQSIAYLSGSSADADTILKPKRLLKQQKRCKEGHDRRRSHHIFLVSAAKDTGYNNAEDTKVSQVDMGLATMVAKRELTNSVNDIETLREALFSVKARAKAAERAKAEALEALARADAKQHEYALVLAKTSEAAIEEIRSAKLSFYNEIDQILEEKLAGKSQKMIAKQDAVNLVAKVEEVAESAILKVAARIVEEVKLRSTVAEMSASVATARVEGRIRNAAVEAANAMISETQDAIRESFAALEAAKGRAREAEAALVLRTQTLDDLVSEEASALGLQQDVSDLRRKLEAAMVEVEQRRAEVKSMEARAKAAEARAAAADAALLEVQESANRSVQEQEESARKALEILKEASAARLEAARAVFKADVEVLEAATRTVNKAEEVQEQAYKRRCRALERSLTTTEASAVAWQDRASAVEDLLLRVREQSAEADEIVGKVDDALIGGRMESFLRDDSRRWDLLANGPRCEAPEWMARRVDLAFQRLPPRKATLEEVEAAEEVEEGILELPSPDDVWCIASAKVIEDTFLQQAAEKAIIDEQRKALERTLERTTPRRLHKPGEDGAKKLESGTGSGREIVFQGFNWESWRRQWYLELAPKAADLSKCGITTIWFPPPTQSVAPQGYMPSDLYNLNSAYGTVEELKLCIEEMHKHDLLVLGDAVLNHRCAQKQSPNGVWNIFDGKLAWGPEAIVRDDPNFQGRGNLSSGDIFHAAPNIDHSQDFVQRDIKEWLRWLRTEIGYDGWRLDFVRGFWGGYVKEYVESSQPAFAIGEYWDSLAYEGGTICYNQDAHRQRIINWINATGGTSSAFDVTTKGILHAALHNQYWRLIDPQGKPPGVIGWWPSRAVTFLENHDTGSTQGHWPFPRDKLMQGYAYILTHPGTPVIFYDHFYDFGLHDEIAELIKIRNTSGVHCRSAIQIYQASNEGYAAQIGENLVVKLGYMDWNPSKQMNLVGNWNRCIDKGADYQVWIKS